MKPPRGQYLGEISNASSVGIETIVDNMSEIAILKRNRFVTVRMSFLLKTTIQTRAFP